MKTLLGEVGVVDSRRKEPVRPLSTQLETSFSLRVFKQQSIRDERCLNQFT